VLRRTQPPAATSIWKTFRTRVDTNITAIDAHAALGDPQKELASDIVLHGCIMSSVEYRLQKSSNKRKKVPSSTSKEMSETESHTEVDGRCSSLSPLLVLPFHMLWADLQP
jgi:hypothetical protein